MKGWAETIKIDWVNPTEGASNQVLPSYAGRANNRDLDRGGVVRLRAPHWR